MYEVKEKTRGATLFFCSPTTQKDNQKTPKNIDKKYKKVYNITINKSRGKRNNPKRRIAKCLMIH